MVPPGERPELDPLLAPDVARAAAFDLLEAAAAEVSERALSEETGEAEAVEVTKSVTGPAVVLPALSTEADAVTTDEMTTTDEGDASEEN